MRRKDRDCDRRSPSGTEAMLYERRDDGSVDCRVCPRLCHILPAKSGSCRARVNRDGTLLRDHLRPRLQRGGRSRREEAPLSFLPRLPRCSRSGASAATSRAVTARTGRSPMLILPRRPATCGSSPCATCPVLADHNDCQGVAWTYNEPTIWLEYILDGAQLAHRARRLHGDGHQRVHH